MIKDSPHKQIAAPDIGTPRPAPSSTRPWLWPLLVAGLTLCGLAVRLFNLGAGDYTAQTALALAILQNPADQIWQAAAQAGQPGGYYYLLRLLDSRSFMLLVLPSLCFSTLHIPLAYTLARMVAGKQLSLLAAFLAVIFPPSIAAGQEIGPLAALLCFGGLLAVLTYRWLQADRANSPSMLLLSALYVVTAIAGLSASYYFIFVWFWAYIWVILAQQALRHALQPQPTRFIHGGMRSDLPGPLFNWIWSGTQLIVLALYFPQIPGIQRWASGYLTQEPAGSSKIGDIWSMLLLGPATEPGVAWLTCILLSLLAIVGATYLLRRHTLLEEKVEPDFTGKADTWLPVVLLAGSLLFPLVCVSLTEIANGKPYNAAYWDMGYSITLPVLLAAGIRAIRALAVPAALLVGLLAVGTLLEGINAQYAGANRLPYRAALAEMNEQILPGDIVLDYGDLNQVLVVPDSLAVQVYRDPTQYRAAKKPDDKVILLPGQAFAQETQDLLQTYPRIWVLSPSTANSDLESGSAILIDRKVFGDSGSSLTMSSYTHVLSAGGGRGTDIGPLRLLSPATYPATASGGSDLALRLLWTVTQPTGINYRMVVHLVDSEGTIWQSRDRIPLGNGHLYPISKWQPGEALIDAWRFPLPPGAPPGDYHLQLGIYDPSSNQFLKVGDSTAIDLGLLHLGPTFDTGTLHLPAQQTLTPALRFDTRDIALLGYSIDNPIKKPGEMLKLDLFWRAGTVNPQPAMLGLRLVDAQGRSIAQEESGFAYSLAGWLPGQIVRERPALQIPSDAPNGLYRLQVALVDTASAPRYTNLAELRIQGREHQMALAAAPQFPQVATFGQGIKMLGYDLLKQAIRPGDDIHIRFLWQATAKMASSYKVTVQLLRMTAQGWAVAAQQDTYPCGGDCLTTGWAPGEYLADEYSLHVKQDTPPGEYQLLVAFYDEAKQGQRIATSSGTTEIFLQQKITVLP